MSGKAIATRQGGVAVSRLIKNAAMWLAAACVAISACAVAAPREVRVGVYQNAPKIFPAPDGQPSGILGDLLGEIARAEGWMLVPVPCTWHECLQALSEGRIDVLPDLAYSPERARIYDFHSVPVLHSWSVIYLARGTRIDSMRDLQGKRIAILRDSVQESYLSGLLPDFGVQARLIPVDSLEAGFAKVADGTADMAVANRFFGDWEAARFHLLPSSIEFQPALIYYGTRRGANADILAAVDRHLAAWQADPGSFYFDTLRKWAGVLPVTVVPAWARQGLLVLAGLLAAALLVMVWLRRQLSEKSRSVEEGRLALQHSEERYRIYVEHAPEGIFVSDLEGRLVDANPSACRMVGYPRDVLLQMNIFDLAALEDADRQKQLFEGLLRTGRLDDELRLRHQTGAVIVTSLSAVRLPGGMIIGSCLDITERKASEAKIRSLAYYDPLTGLPNRRLLMDRLGQAMASSQREGEYGLLLMLDLDHFKVLNDTEGHDVGDRLLVAVARRLGRAVRGDDTIARFGGDEYVVIAEALGRDEKQAAMRAEAIAVKIRETIDRPFDLLPGKPSFFSTPSMGAVLFLGQETSIEVLLKQVDVALYQAKNAGRNAIRFFNPAMQAAIDERAALESALRKGIREREFRLFYQPQVDCDGRLIGAEALLRWLPAGRAPVSPAEFVPLAESTGLILQIGQWVIREACVQLARWQADPAMRGLSLSVNVSGRQFLQADFVEEVIAEVGRAGIEPGRLKLELTESVVIDRLEEVVARMHALKAAGIGFALDDFGTGYSSLSYLKRLPLGQIKIDQSFVRDITHDPNDAAIVRAILAMSLSLGLDVVAEGVETESQRAFLHEAGCRKYQGYLFSRPLPLEEWPAELRPATAGA